MLRTTLLLLCLCLFVFQLKAQADGDYQKIRLGIICSPLVSWGSSDASAIDPQGSKLGINIGLMVDKYFARNYAFASGLSIHTMGASVVYNNGINTFVAKDNTYTGVKQGTTVKYSLQYIDVPFGLKMRTPQIGYVTIWAQLGFNAMININASADAKSTCDSGSFDLNGTNVPDMVNTFYMGYHIFLGAEYKIIGNTAITAGIGYLNGFTDVTVDRGNTNEKLTLNNVELRLGLIF